jgi:hypothetical protein
MSFIGNALRLRRAPLSVRATFAEELAARRQTQYALPSQLKEVRSDENATCSASSRTSRGGAGQRTNRVPSELGRNLGHDDNRSELWLHDGNRHVHRGGHALAGTAFDPGDETEFTCAGSIGDTSIDVSCSGSFEADGCTVTFSFIVTGTRSGDSYTGTETFSITYEGACGPVPDQCTESEVSGVRTGPPPPACASTPVTSSEWGRIKRIYR